MKEPSFIDDLQKIKENWHDPEWRRGFWIGGLKAFVPTFIGSFVAALLVTVIIVFIS
jgi:hypothetical protein